MSWSAPRGQVDGVPRRRLLFFNAMSSEREQLESGIAALESQRSLLGDVVVDASVSGLRARLAAFSAPGPAEPAQTLKQVSILFLDAVGSTTLSRHLDPEEISAVMDDALTRGTAIVQAHQGKVLQYAGDNILAAFGADEAKEDDAERAVRCGLALCELGRVLGAEVLTTRGHAGFGVRVGIHTGGVMLGGGVDADGSIRGISVNVAARMEQTAPAGALRISHDTYSMVRGLFEVDAQAPLAVKGMDAPMQSYLVVRAKPRNFRIDSRGVEGLATKMVGREAELQAMQAAFLRLYSADPARRRLAVVTVVADAGIGKSRLLYEYEAWSEARPEAFYIFRGRAGPQTQRLPFGLLRDILAWRFQIADDDTLQVARAKLEQGIIPLFVHDDGPELAEGHAHLLGHLIGIEWRDSPHLRGIVDDPKQIRNRAFHAAAQIFRRMATGDGGQAGLPIVLQLEDLHWADGESLDFLDYLIETDRDLPMLILGFARPTLFERRADWQRSEDVHQRIDLEPLDHGASRLLAAELLRKLPDAPAAVSELIIGRAEGNPFYMEELVKMLHDQGAIATAPEGWTLNAEKLRATQVPPTLTGVLQARLDGLPGAERLTLQEASVIGHVFWDQALIALDAQATQTLPRLVQRDLTRPRADAALDGLREYAFKHQILHQVTYQTVLKRFRRELHGKLARWLAAQSGLNAKDFLGFAAEHFEEAGDTANAAEFHARAAEYAASRFANEAALAHVQRALDLLGPKSDAHALRWRLLDARERTFDLQGQRAGQLADIEALERIADALDDDQRRAEAAYRRAYRALRMADWPAAQAAAQQAKTLAQRVGADELRLLAQRLVATAMAMQGDREAGKGLARQTLAEAQALGLRKVEAACLATLSAIANLDGDIVTTLEMNTQVLAIHRQAGDRRGEALTLANLGGARLSLGDLDQARRNLEDSLRLLRANGDLVIEGATLCLCATLDLNAGEPASAQRLACAALDIAVAVQAREWEAVALYRLGDAELGLGRHSAAVQAFERCRTLAMAIGNPFQHPATAGLARVALARGDLAAALHAALPLLEHAATAGADELIDRQLIELTCHRVLAAAGDERAAEWLQLAHRTMRRQADRISDAVLRQGYLDNIPENREVAAAWAAQDRGTG